MDLRGERDAVQARLDAAEAAALLALPGIVVAPPSGRNRIVWIPDSETSYTRGYRRRAGARRLAMGEEFDRYDAIIFVQIMVPEEIGDDPVFDVWEAIKPSFKTNGDGLEFEDPADLSDGLKDGSHFVAVASFPYYFDVLHTG